ncbi:MAG: SRPBCC family protein [Solirubrobacteraceae bacterium]
MSTITGGRRAQVSLPADDQILITREFDAPPHLVFEAWTTPDLVKRWWHARRGEVTSIEVDLRVGGKWRYAMIANGGFEVAFHGEYREIVAGERIVSTEVYEGAPGAEALTTATFTDHDGGTLLTILVEHANRENRDVHINAGMEDGLNDALALLEQVVRTRS